MSVKKKLGFSALLLAIGAGAMSGSAFAQLDPIEGYLTSAEQKAKSVIRVAGTEGRGVVMEAGSAVLNAISLFRSVYRDSLKETDASLTGARAALFRDIRNTTEALGAETRTATAGLEQLTDKLAGTVANLPLGKDVPRLTSVSPLFSVAGDDTAQVSVKGLFLTHGKPAMDMQGKQSAPTTGIPTLLRFDAASAAPNIDRPLVVAAELSVFERKDFLLFWDTFERKTYPLQLAVYPKLIGPATLTPTLLVPQTITVPRTGSYMRCESPRGRDSNTVEATIVATEDFTINAGGKDFVREHVESGTHTFSSESPTSFKVTLTCTGFGYVRVVDEGSVGVIAGRVTYTESRTTDGYVPGQPIPFPFHWSDSRVDRWPANTVAVIFAVTPTFKPQTLQLDSAGTMKYATMDFNPTTKTSTLRARKIEDALREP